MAEYQGMPYKIANAYIKILNLKSGMKGSIKGRIIKVITILKGIRS